MMIKKSDESVRQTDEKVPPQEAFVEGVDIEDPLEKVGLQMDPAEHPPYTSQLFHHLLLSLFSPPSLVPPVLE